MFLRVSNISIIISFVYSFFSVSLGFIPNTIPVFRLQKLNAELKKDNNGYIIKDRDWFNGLRFTYNVIFNYRSNNFIIYSVDPGNSLADPRAVPPEAKAFAEKIKSGELNSKITLKETLALIDELYEVLIL